MPANLAQNPAEREPTHLLLFFALLALSCAFVLSLPVFPSQDGPMHVYFVHILGALISHAPSPYKSFFTIRSYIPPYSVYYYLLMLLMKLAPVALAERLMVCIIFVVQACGFRWLARALGPSAGLAALWSLPLLLNWPVAMGFQNFSLSLALSMWALGIWWRMRTDPTPQRLALFLLTVLFVVTAHPVPLLFVLAVTGLDLLFRYLATRSLAALKLPIAGFCLACLGIPYVLHFSDKHRMAQNAGDSAARLDSLHRIIKLSTLGIFSGQSIGTYAYRIGLYLLFIAALGVGFRAMRARGLKPVAFTLAHPWLLIALGGAVITCIAPSDMNGSHFFSDRLVLIPWLCALLAAAVHPRLALRQQNILAALSAGTVLAVLWMANDRIRPIANEQAAARATPLNQPPGATGLLLGGTLTQAEETMLQRVSYNAYAWQPAYKFDQAQAILLNPPWLDLPILPIAQQPTDLDRRYSPQVLDSPGNMLTVLATEPPAERAPLLSRARFILLSTRAEAARAGLTPANGWTCSDLPPYLLCNQAPWPAHNP